MTAYKKEPEVISPDDLYACHALRRFRIRNDVSLMDMATALNKSYQQIQKYETGVNRMTAGTIAKAARYLGVPPAAFFDQEYDFDDKVVKNQTIVHTICKLLKSQGY